MASLDEGSVGIKVLAGLPENNGLPAIAEKLLDDPQSVFALVELRPRHEVHNIDTDSHTLVLRMVQVEPLSGTAADRLREQLRKVREKRTGVVPLPGVDGAEVPPADGGDEDGGAGGLPTGPEWGDGDGPKVPGEPVPTAAADTTTTATTGAPPFAPPTPIGEGRKSG